MTTQETPPRRMPADIREVAQLWRDMLSSLTDSMQQDAAEWLLELGSAMRAWRAGGEEPDWRDFRLWANDICLDDGMPPLFSE